MDIFDIRLYKILTFPFLPKNIDFLFKLIQ